MERGCIEKKHSLERLLCIGKKLKASHTKEAAHPVSFSFLSLGIEEQLRRIDDSIELDCFKGFAKGEKEGGWDGPLLRLARRSREIHIA